MIKSALSTLFLFLVAGIVSYGSYMVVSRSLTDETNVKLVSEVGSKMKGIYSNIYVLAENKPSNSVVLGTSVTKNLDENCKPVAYLELKTNSVVDYLYANKVDYSYSSRSRLAEKYGIKNYQGTGEQNTKLIEIISQSNGCNKIN
jgi:hypothetical protein